MRFIVAVAIAAILAPATLSARAPAPQPDAAVTDFSAARKKAKKPGAPKEEYLKAAPGTGPSGPKTK